MIDFNPAQTCDFGDPAYPDTQAVNATLLTGAFVPLWIFTSARAFDLNLLGGDSITWLTPTPAPGPPVVIEWMLHGGVIAGSCKVFDDQECAATATVLQGADLAAAGVRSGVLFNVEGAEFNAYLLRGRIVTAGLDLQGRVTLAALRAPPSGPGFSVRVGGYSG